MPQQPRATEPEGFHAQPRAIEDDDVEGHSALLRAAEPEGLMQRRATEDDDVEGHGHGTPRAVEDDDVEGHGHGTPRAVEPEGFNAHPRAVEDDDVEGHYGLIKSPSSRGE